MATYQGFLKKHEEKYGEPPLSAFHAHAYDATNMIAAAIEQVAMQNGDTLIIGKQALRDAIGATKDFKGLTGNITCSPTATAPTPRLPSTKSPTRRHGIRT